MDRTLEEWIPTRKELELLVNMSGVSFTKAYLKRHRARIGPSSFHSGLNIVLLEAVRCGNVNLISFIVKKLAPMCFNIGAPITYVQEWTDHSCHQVYNDFRKIMVSPRFANLVTPAARARCRSATPIHLAITHHIPLDVIKCLVQHGASVNMTNCCGQPPLVASIQGQRMECSKYLIEQGADVNQQDHRGYTPLMYSTMATSLQMIHLLLKAGADPNITDKRGLTVLHIALENDHSFVQQLFSLGLVPSLTAHPHTSRHHGNHTLFINHHPSAELLHIISNCSPLQQFDTLLLQCTYPIPITTSQILSFKQNLEEALNLKAAKNLVPNYSTQDAYGGRQEVQSLEELNELFEGDEPTLREELLHQCLIIRERVAGYGSLSVVCALIDQEVSYIDKTRGLQLLLRASEMILYRARNITPDAKTHSLLDKLLAKLENTIHGFFKQPHAEELISALISNLLQAVGRHMKDVLEMHDHSMEGDFFKENDHFFPCCPILSTLAKKALHIILICRASGYDRNTSFAIAVREFVGNCPRFPIPPTSMCHFTTLFHFAVSSTFPPQYDTTALLSYLLEQGAAKDINVPDSNGVYPLHSVVQSRDKDRRKLILPLLLDHGVHVDCVDYKGNSAIEYIGHKDCATFGLLHSQYPLPLSCLCAQTIVGHGVPYMDMDLPQHLKKLISLHDSCKVSVHVT